MKNCYLFLMLMIFCNQASASFPVNFYGGVEYTHSSFSSRHGIKLESDTVVIMNNSRGYNYFVGVGLNSIFSKKTHYGRLNIVSFEVEYSNMDRFSDKSITQERTNISDYWLSLKSAKVFLKFTLPSPYYNFTNKTIGLSNSIGFYMRLGAGVIRILDGPDSFHTGRKTMTALGFGVEYHTKYYLILRAGVTASYFGTTYSWNPSLELEEAGVITSGDGKILDVTTTNILTSYSIGVGLEF